MREATVVRCTCPLLAGGPWPMVGGLVASGRRAGRPPLSHSASSLLRRFFPTDGAIVGPGRMGCAGSTTCPLPGKLSAISRGSRTSFRNADGMAWGSPYHPFLSAMHAAPGQWRPSPRSVRTSGFVLRAGFQDFRPDRGRGIGRTSKPNRLPPWGRLPFFGVLAGVDVRLVLATRDFH